MPRYTLHEIARHINGVIEGDGDLEIHSPAEIASAEKGQITFLANPRYQHYLETTQASAIIVDRTTPVPEHLAAVRVEDPYVAFLQVVRLFFPPREFLDPGVHPTAVVDASARLGDDVRIGANAVIGKGVSIGDGSRIFPGVVIMENVKIGKNCVLYPGVVIREDCEIGDHVILHSGVVIGSDGFGFAFQQGKYEKIPQVGRVVIESNVEIGANTAIDRATLGETRIGEGTKIDNLVQIAHNVRIGKHCVMSGQVGIAGSTHIGDYCVFGGQVGVNGHIRIGNKVTVAAKAGVTKDIEDGQTVFGFPARPIQKMRRIEATISQLPELVKRIRQLEAQVATLLEKEGGLNQTNGEKHG
ncbi:MAG TPA: UDP-3-O-(3-hydroxymyristoyl)glucosamine N-acyltransferase [Calditrichae bacterium]|nr:UDP-3-O-(3-hydroxymyristoyl)glucosamine N-acyltransferase [Calditrichia bacterium]